MSTFPRTVVEFVSPPFVGPVVPHMIVNGQAITQQGLEIEWSREPEVPTMTTASGLSIFHHLPESPLAPITTSPRGVSGTVSQPSENTRDALDLAEALSRGGFLSVWFDLPALEVWISDGATPALVTSRPFGWATALPHGVTSANRPARAWTTNTAPASALTVVYGGAPAAGEILIPDTGDGTAVTLGSAPAAGTLIIVQSTWLYRGKFDVSPHERGSLAEYEISFDFEEIVPERSFS